MHYREKTLFSPLSLKNRELAITAVCSSLKRVRGVIERNNEAVMLIVDDNFAGKTKLGEWVEETEHTLLSLKANRLQPKIHGGSRMNN